MGLHQTSVMRFQKNRRALLASDSPFRRYVRKAFREPLKLDALALCNVMLDRFFPESVAIRDRN